MQRLGDEQCMQSSGSIKKITTDIMQGTSITVINESYKKAHGTRHDMFCNFSRVNRSSFVSYCSKYVLNWSYKCIYYSEEGGHDNKKLEIDDETAGVTIRCDGWSDLEWSYD